jgi:hypothetical protein
MTPQTSIRLIEVGDAEAIAHHLGRDHAKLARWEPARPEGFHTTSHQVGRIETLLDTHAEGGGWPPRPRDRDTRAARSAAHAHIYLDGAWHDDVFWERTLTDR